MQSSDVSSFLGPNFMVLSLGVHPERVYEKEVHPVNSTNLTNNLQ